MVIHEFKYISKRIDGKKKKHQISSDKFWQFSYIIEIYITYI